ncbi:MAG: hypothetical protein Q9217_002329 [Psora testacea]
MGKRAANKATYESGDGFVEAEPPQSKKVKSDSSKKKRNVERDVSVKQKSEKNKNKNKNQKKKKEDEDEDEDEQQEESLVDTVEGVKGKDGSIFWEGTSRHPLLMLVPTQGISLTVDQYNTVMGLLPSVASVLGAKGAEVVSPDFGSAAASKAREAQSGEDEEADDDDDDDDDE